MKLSAKEITEHSTWQEMTLGGEIYEPATSKLVNTGAWRTNTPVLDTACPSARTALCRSKAASCWALTTTTARAAASAPKSVPLGRCL